MLLAIAPITKEAGRSCTGFLGSSAQDSQDYLVLILMVAPILRLIASHISRIERFPKMLIDIEPKPLT
jgi:hypothetical protein